MKLIIAHAIFNTPGYLYSPPGRSLVDYLVKEGFEPIVYSPPGYTSSGRSDANFFEIVRDFDAFVETHVGEYERVALLGHSVGGIVGMCSKFARSNRFSSIVLVSPAIWSLTKPRFSKSAVLQVIQLALAVTAATLIGHLPSKRLGLGSVSHSSRYFGSFLRMFLFGGVMEKRGGLGLEDNWRKTKSKMLVLNAERDRWMAPAPNAIWVSERLPPQAVTIVAAKKSAFQYSADHFSVIYGRTAAEKVWPIVANFLKTQ